MAEPKSSSTAVAVRDPAVGLISAGEVEYPLDAFPVDQFNRLIPTETIRIPTDLLVPVVQVVRLTADDVYHSNDMKAGHSAPNRTGLRKFVTAAGITVVDQRRTDDGTNPDVCEMTTVMEMLLPTGQRIRATGVKRIDLNTQAWSKDNPVAHRAKFKAFFQEHVASRSENRAIRALLSLRGSYPDQELKKPFAVVSFVPNMNHPEIRSRILDSFAPAITAGFGPEPRQIPAGDVQQLPEAPDDDVIEGQSRDANVEPTEPDWFTGAAAEPQPPRLVEVLREKATTSGLAGDMTDPQKSAVQAAFRGPGNSDPVPLPVVAEGLRVVWGVEPRDGKLPLTAAQAQAIINTARDDDFRRLWVEAFGKAAA